MSEALQKSESDGVLRLTFNRPERLNALDRGVALELVEALRDAGERRAVRCIVLGGAGRAFSSGQDLSAITACYERGEPFVVGEDLRAGYNRAALALQRLEKPTIAAITGAAAGVGVSLALACDVRIAADDARFTLGFSKLGLIPDGGASYLLPRLVGLGRAFALAYTSERIDAAEALRIGLVDRVVPAADFEREVARFAATIAERPVNGLKLTKRAFLRAAACDDFAAWLDEEAELQDEASRDPDFREGVAAFVEKRAPRFSV